MIIFNLNKIICITVAILMLHGCAKPEFSDCDVAPRKIKNGTKALLITKIYVPFEDLFHNKGMHEGFIVITNKNQPDLKYKIIGSDYLKSAAMIQPGNYEIIKYGWTDGIFEYSFKHQTKYFEIKYGECLYLGDIEIIKDQNRIIEVKAHNNILIAQSKLTDSKLDALKNSLKLIQLQSTPSNA